MSTNAMKTWLASSHLSGANSTYIETLYESYLQDPFTVDADWRALFDEFPQVSELPEEAHSVIRMQMKDAVKKTKYFRTSQDVVHNDAKQVKVLQLIGSYRSRGHEAAKLEPLGLIKPETIKDLDPFYHDLEGSDLDESFNVGSYAAGNETMVLHDLVASLQRTYCGSIGVEYMHINNSEEKCWLQKRIESCESTPSFTVEAKKRFLEELTAAEGLERYLGAKFPGAKRFSLEGGDSFVPMLKELVRRAGEQGAQEVVLAY